MVRCPARVLNPDQIRSEIGTIRLRSSKPINVNFFCHVPASIEPAREEAWRRRLKPYYIELGLDPEMPVPISAIAPFGGAHCDLVEELKPEIVSFHLRPARQRPVKAGEGYGRKNSIVSDPPSMRPCGSKTMAAMRSSPKASKPAVIAECFSPMIFPRRWGIMALAPQIADAVKAPVIAAGGIADARGIAAALALGASAVQIGTAYLFCPEANVASPA